jgi:release factor glutamine methyltransferase
VRRDPALALDGGPTGLEVPLRLVEQALPHLHSASVLAMELGHDQGERAANWMRERGFGRVDLHKDLAHIPRFIIATDCPSPPEAASPTLPDPAPET